jgi:hypothetical protein
VPLDHVHMHAVCGLRANQNTYALKDPIIDDTCPPGSRFSKFKKDPQLYKTRHFKM